MGPEEMDWEDVDQEIQDIPNAHFDVLNSSLPGYLTRTSSCLDFRTELTPSLSREYWVRNRIRDERTDTGIISWARVSRSS
jgi:hypothetical protein